MKKTTITNIVHKENNQILVAFSPGMLANKCREEFGGTLISLCSVDFPTSGHYQWIEEGGYTGCGHLLLVLKYKTETSYVVMMDEGGNAYALAVYNIKNNSKYNNSINVFEENLKPEIKDRLTEEEWLEFFTETAVNAPLIEDL
jgi:hypothetical protein